MSVAKQIIFFCTGASWEEVIPKGGKSLDVRLAGHSAVYHSDSRSLVVFGGHSPHLPRFTQHR